MQQAFSIENHVVHFWQAYLPDLHSKENSLTEILSPDELERANRFYFPEHRHRFILARGILRQILSCYLSIHPREIIFSYTHRGKPYLLNNAIDLKFNVSHSDEYAVYVVTKKYEIGVDIEKIKDKFSEGIAERYFSQNEYEALVKLPEAERLQAFYRLWAAKEALIKALGEGLYAPLDNFTVAIEPDSQWISLTHEGHENNYFLKNINVDTHYQAAFATDEEVNEILHWEWSVKGPKRIRM